MSAPTQTIFEHVLARPVDRPGGVDPKLVHVSWSAPQQGNRLAQVYVNDRLHEVSPWPEARELWLLLDRRRSHRIELLAIDANDERGVWRSRADQLAGWSPAVTDVASLAVLRDQKLPVDARFAVTVDGALSDRGAVWPGDVPRSGFGAVFGEGGFGIDAAAGPGLGLGELGYGPLGSDGSAWRWRRADLNEGTHDLTVAAIDGEGQAASSPLTQSITIQRLPQPAADLRVDNDFTLRWEP